MIPIVTYQLTPFLPSNYFGAELNTEWIRKVVSKLKRKSQYKLEAEDVDTSLYYNHNSETNQNIVGYPKIIYHYINYQFYITGLLDGVKPLEKLASIYKNDFKMDGVFLTGFKKIETISENTIFSTSDMQSYKLIKWIPYNHGDFDDYEKMFLTEKAQNLNLKLNLHIDKEMGKNLKIDFPNLKTIITDITNVYPEAVVYGDPPNNYYAYDIKFITNISFPTFITLGNIKSLGFGRIEKIIPNDVHVIKNK